MENCKLNWKHECDGCNECHYIEQEVTNVQPIYDDDPDVFHQYNKPKYIIEPNQDELPF